MLSDLLPRHRSVVALAVLLFVCLLSNAQAADLVINAGETYTVTKAEQNLQLQKLQIGDAAKVQFADDVSYWEVVASSAQIGKDVLIDASGKSGVAAKGLPASLKNSSKACESPVTGETGPSGGAGGDGLNISLRFDRAEIGGLTIDVRGGTGGAGGQGGQGSSAAACEIGSGGQAGTGGVGGEGGHGGHVLLEIGASAGDWQQLSRAVKVLADAGKGGAGGDPGLPGAAAPGRYVNKKTLTGNRKWESGGAEGGPGKPGNRGVSGRKGTIIVRPLSASLAQSPVAMHKTEPSFKSKRDNSNKRPDSDHIQQIHDELRALRQRIEQLEQKFLQYSRKNQ